MNRDQVDKLRNARASLARALTRRDEAIIEAHLAGASLREIAKHAGLTHAGVADVLRRHGYQPTPRARKPVEPARWDVAARAWES